MNDQQERKTTPSFVPSFKPDKAILASMDNSAKATKKTVASKSFVPTPTTLEDQAPPSIPFLGQFDVTPTSVFHSSEGTTPSFYSATTVPGSRLFMSPTLYDSLIARKTIPMQVSPDPTVPNHICGYHTIGLLEGPSEAPSAVWGRSTVRYRGVSHDTSEAHCLIRIDGVSTLSSDSLATAKTLNHPGIVALRNAVVTKEFLGRSTSLLIATDLYPNSVTLRAAHTNNPPPDDVLVAYVVQLVDAVRYLMTVRRHPVVVDPSKILLVGVNRVKLNSVGVPDIISARPRAQVCDETGLTNTIIFLATGGSRQPQRPLPLPVANVVSALRSGAGIDRVQALLQAGFSTVMTGALSYADHLEDALSKSMFSGQLMDLLAKLSYVVVTRTGPVGDVHILTLFHSSLFGAVDGVSMLSVARALAMLGAGNPEYVGLRAQNDDAVVVVSYAELLMMLDRCWLETSTLKS
ncbi:hypothetical protein J8273_2971 [Carpediemonas membranifera]|uniref:Pan3 C-terminal knob domain-containing protein n=1 Tax=Carpediemonas membranifera TaxID=201153 RepID=A0A8J6B6P5_9EUKA|nr:hypothetical protein J8273_2971 [Carpediemonas membranifera]|eukprot:KAG9395404.1 hypothetical protein J8273_2971 [Carpediemonas membranifera]